MKMVASWLKPDMGFSWIFYVYLLETRQFIIMVVMVYKKLDLGMAWQGIGQKIQFVVVR